MFDAASNTVTWIIDNLDPGEEINRDIRLIVEDPTLRDYRNSVEITEDSAEDYGTDPTTGLPEQDVDSTPDSDTGSDDEFGFGEGPNDDVVNDNSFDDNPNDEDDHCLLYTSPSPRDRTRSRMPSSA